MAALEQVMKMRDQGMTERQIIDSLKNEGITPKDINDALSQSKIKTAINTEPQTPPIQPPPKDNFAQSSPSQELGMPAPSNQTTTASSQPTMQPSGQSPIQDEFSIPGPSAQNPQQGEPQMQQSIMSETPSPTPPIPSPSPMPTPSEQIIPSAYPPTTGQGQPGAEYQMPEFYQPNEEYPEYEYQQQVDVETITEIAEQIIEEKIEKLKQQTASLIKVKEELTLKTEKINERLEKIENSFNELQMAILGKVKDYSQDLQTLSSELHATQDSFSKVLNPIIDQQRTTQQDQSYPEEQPIPQETEQPKSRDRPKKSEENFESYLR